MSDMLGEVDGREFLISVDAVIVKEGKVLFGMRAHEPEKGKWSNAGGIVDIDERLVDAVKREAKEETGLDIKIIKQIGVYDALDRDPTRRSITIAFLCEPVGGELTLNNEVSELKWFDLNELPELAFDHAEIVRDAIQL